jgi:hypothetical protein
MRQDRSDAVLVVRTQPIDGRSAGWIGLIRCHGRWLLLELQRADRDIEDCGSCQLRRPIKILPNRLLPGVRLIASFLLVADSFQFELAIRCPFRKSYPNILMMQSGQDWDGDNDTGPLDCSMQGRIFL